MIHRATLIMRWVHRSPVYAFYRHASQGGLSGITISQGSVATTLTCHGMFNDNVTFCRV